MTWWVVLAVLAQVPDAVRKEPAADKRVAAAYVFAGVSVDAARKAHGEADSEGTRKAVEDAAAAVEFALETLEGMGKPPYKNAGNYKKAELRTRELLRRLDTLVKDASVDDREILERAQARVTRVHEKLLEGVMSKKP
jgi:hypothetical protein